MKLPFLFIAAMYAFWSPVAVRVYPQAMLAPGAVRVTAIIERHADNRKLVLKAVQDRTFDIRVSTFSLDGAQSQRVFTPTNKCICWDGLPAGEYELVATLTRMVEGKAQTFTDQRNFRVIGMESEP